MLWCRHPLRIVGWSEAPPSAERGPSVLVVPRGSTCGLAVHANCRLHGITLATQHTGTCVEHHSGRLQLEECTLRCADHHPSFIHLNAPITSLARTAASTMVVMNSCLDGGISAIKCVGTGVVSSTRVICLSRSASLWCVLEFGTLGLPPRLHLTQLFVLGRPRRFSVIATDAPVVDASPALAEKNKEVHDASIKQETEDSMPAAEVCSDQAAT